MSALAAAQGETKAAANNAAVDADPTEEPDVDPNFQVAAQATVEEIMSKDADDEALQKYKASLLGDTAATDPNAKHVEIHALHLIPGAAGADTPAPIMINLRTPEDVERAASEVKQVKAGADFRLQVTFKVQREIVLGLKLMRFVYKHGIRVAKDEFMIGSFPPNGEVQQILCPVETVPSGIMAKGTYKAKCRFIDFDKNVHLECVYKFKIAGDWA